MRERRTISPSSAEGPRKGLCFHKVTGHMGIRKGFTKMHIETKCNAGQKKTIYSAWPSLFRIHAWGW